MDTIEECFAKYFLRQAQEIEPQTIQAIIDRGYRSKLSLTAMDLVLDLPQIDQISLAQRSLLRKYIGALQESQPFVVNLANEALSPKEYKNISDYVPTMPIKKRKYDVYIADNNDSWGNDNDSQQNDSNTPNKLLASGKSFSSPLNSMITSPSNRIIAAASPLNETTTKRQSSRRMSNNHHENDDQHPARDEIGSQTMIIDETVMIEQESMKPERGRKSNVVRTPSQIRYEKMRKSLNFNNIQNVVSDNASVASETTDLDVVRTNRGRKAANNRVPRTTSQIRYEMLKNSSNNSFTQDDSNNQQSTTSVTTSTSSTKSKAMTPAERAIKARIEAKKMEQKTKKTVATRKRQTKR
ncbi:hypothetical protein QR98_0102090 [Sarcoptes scabiei]|uniref:Uncharacterized protein n=1 Tax=Sarcoptes scabiei TaxID=52283 RepID=A0A132AKX5_SARSC|nr:hypothetical protein QR98_0102090 [Sarcoptes scabiei]